MLASERSGQVGPVLRTRLSGRPVVLVQVETGFGPVMWAGDIRSDADLSQPVFTHAGHHQPWLPALRIGTLPGVLAVLQRMAASWEFRP